MAEPRAYPSARAFRRALEDRLKSRADAERLDLARLARRVAFERFLARLFVDASPHWLLKGGYAMEVRHRHEARATKDVDLSLPDGSLIALDGKPNPEVLLTKLRAALEQDLNDWFEFKLSDPVQDLTAAPYGGWRFRVEARLDARRFTEFKLDVGVGDAVVAEPEWTEGHDLLSFAGIPPARIALLPREQQFAEKIHAYSLPRERTNTRVRDLVDLLLLIQKGLPEKPKVAASVRATFSRRGTHAVPDVPQTPPGDWDAPFRRLAEEVELKPSDIQAAYKIVRDYWRGLDL